MKITDALLGEHAVIYPGLDRIVEASFATAEEMRAAAAILAAGLASHARIEDELLFVPLEEQIGGEMGPLAVMRLEHDEIEGVLERLQEVEGPTEGRTIATRLAQLARDHFAKEEQVLYPMAENVLDADELERLGAEWASRRLP